MKPLLKEQDYNEAILTGVREIAEILKNGEFEEEELSWFSVMILGLVFLCIFEHFRPYYYIFDISRVLESIRFYRTLFNPMVLVVRKELLPTKRERKTNTPKRSRYGAQIQRRTRRICYYHYVPDLFGELPCSNVFIFRSPARARR